MSPSIPMYYGYGSHYNFINMNAYWRVLEEKYTVELQQKEMQQNRLKYNQVMLELNDVINTQYQIYHKSIYANVIVQLQQLFKFEQMMNDFKCFDKQHVAYEIEQCMDERLIYEHITNELNVYVPHVDTHDSTSMTVQPYTHARRYKNNNDVFSLSAVAPAHDNSHESHVHPDTDHNHDRHSKHSPSQSDNAYCTRSSQSCEYSMNGVAHDSSPIDGCSLFHALQPIWHDTTCSSHSLIPAHKQLHSSNVPPEAFVSLLSSMFFIYYANSTWFAIPSMHAITTSITPAYAIGVT